MTLICGQTRALMRLVDSVHACTSLCRFLPDKSTDVNFQLLGAFILASPYS